MKKQSSLTLIISCLASILVQNCFARVSVWDGSSSIAWYLNSTEENVYHIASAADLAGLAQITNSLNSLKEDNCVFYLDCDIDLANRKWDPIGTVIYSDNQYIDFSFQGRFEGQGHTISGLSVTPANNEIDIVYAGLFGLVSNSCIKDLSVQGSIDLRNLREVQYMSTYMGMVAQCNDSYITNCIADINMNIHQTSNSNMKVYAGGITGAYRGKKSTGISNCSTYGSINIETDGDQNTLYVGGITGQGTASEASLSCLQTGSIITVRGGRAFCGGIIADPHASSISDTYFHGKISAGIAKYALAGGIAASLDKESAINNCLVTGELKKENGASFASAIVAQDISAYSHVVQNAYYLDGILNSTGVGTKRTESQLKSGTPLDGFDTDLWIFETGSYPRMENVKMPENNYEGDCGDDGSNVTWSFDPQTQELHIQGIGKMASYLDKPAIFDEAKTVIVHDGVTAIGAKSFHDCINLETVVLPHGLSEIGVYAFYKCQKLATINLPSSLQTIETAAFSGCNSLIEVEIPEGVIKLGAEAYYECKNLLYVRVPNTVGKIEHHTFSGCGALSSVVLGKSLESIEEAAFGNCCNLSSILLPEQLRRIKKDAFSSTSLTSLVLPENLKEIYDHAFYCSTLEDVYIKFDEPVYISGTIFNESAIANATLHVPDAKMEYYTKTSPWKKFGNIVPIEEQQCEAPVIEYADGKLKISSSTHGATCYYSITSDDMVNNKKIADDIELTATYKITAYATAEGMSRSQYSHALLCWLPQDTDESIIVIESNPVLIYSISGGIMISGIVGVIQVDFYNTAGVCLGSRSVNDGNVFFETEEEMIIVHIGQRSFIVAIQ